MLTIFDTSRSILFFPTRWANSVTRWLTGLYSPDGTISIANTADPTESGGCAISANVEAIYQQLKERMAQDFALKSELGREVAAQSDTSLSYQGGGLHVDVDALDVVSGGGSTPTVNGYTGTVTGVPYGTSTATCTMYYKDGLRYNEASCATLYSSSQILNGKYAYFTNGLLTQYGTTTVSSSSITITSGTFTFYWNAGHLKSVNGSPY